MRARPRREAGWTVRLAAAVAAGLVAVVLGGCATPPTPIIIGSPGAHGPGVTPATDLPGLPPRFRAPPRHIQRPMRRWPAARW